MYEFKLILRLNIILIFLMTLTFIKNLEKDYIIVLKKKIFLKNYLLFFIPLYYTVFNIVINLILKINFKFWYVNLLLPIFYFLTILIYKIIKKIISNLKYQEKNKEIYKIIDKTCKNYTYKNQNYNIKIDCNVQDNFYYFNIKIYIHLTNLDKESFLKKIKQDLNQIENIKYEITIKDNKLK